MVNDILDFSKLKEGKLPLLASPFSLDELLGGVLSVARPLALAKGLTISVHTTYPSSKTHLGDIRRLRQVVLNLLSNAIKFTNQGQVQLNVSWDGGLLHCSVEDSGIGMSQEACKRLFADFVQLDHSENRGGSGLGLAICRQLIQRMGGEIGVDSQLHVGSPYV